MAPARILLIEDDPFLHELYHDLLTSEGYDITDIMDGDKALEEIKKNTWDLILLDVILPGKDGFQILDELEQEKIALSCPLVFLTNLDASESNERQLARAREHWIKSNLEPPDFLAHVARILAEK